MKAVFISAYQAFYQDILELFNQLEIRGFTYWDEVQGRGHFNGEPHYGSHAWPTLNCAFLTMIEDHQVEPLMQKLRELDETAPLQGLRAFVLPCLEML